MCHTKPFVCMDCPLECVAIIHQCGKVPTKCLYEKTTVKWIPETEAKGKKIGEMILWLQANKEIFEKIK